MLKITVPAGEFYNEKLEEFVYTKETVLRLEHSLISLSNWESNWKVPFLASDDSQVKLTQEQIMDYIKEMTITPNVDPMVYYAITKENMDAIVAYIQEQRTATWFGKSKPQAGKRDTRPMTSERIYYFMVEYNVPFECAKWHLSRLLTLIRICQEEQKEQEKKTPKDAAMARHNLNAARRAKKPRMH